MTTGGPDAPANAVITDSFDGVQALSLVIPRGTPGTLTTKIDGGTHNSVYDTNDPQPIPLAVRAAAIASILGD